MTLFDLRDAADALLDLLERERQAIRLAQFDVLERLAAEKDRLIQAVARDLPDPERMQALRREAHRNAGLLSAMQAGVRRAQRRVAEARKPRRFSTYTESGGRVAAASAATLAKKA